MLELILGLFLVVSTMGIGLSKINEEIGSIRAPRKHTKPLSLDKDLFSNT